MAWQHDEQWCKTCICQEASSQLAGVSEEHSLRARIEALNEEHELLLSTAVKQDEDVASAHRALQVLPAGLLMP